MRRGRILASYSLAFGIGLSLVAMIAALGPRESKYISKVTIGTRDVVYYSRAATETDARALGQVLGTAGFFDDRGNTAYLSRGSRGTIVSFVLKEGAWDRPGAVTLFAEIGLRIAASVGGLPIKVQLVNAAGAVHKRLAVGKATIGARDAVYYAGSATKADAEVLGRALKAAGYLRDAGVGVELTKGEGTAISFVVSGDSWQRPEVVAGFEDLSRRVAASVGWLPVRLRLLDNEAAVKREMVVE